MNMTAVETFCRAARSNPSAVAKVESALDRTGKSTIVKWGRDSYEFSGKTVKKDGLGARLKSLFSSKSELHRLASKDKLSGKERVRFAQLKERRLTALENRQWGDSNAPYTTKHKAERVFLKDAEQRLGVGTYKRERSIARDGFSI